MKYTEETIMGYNTYLKQIRMLKAQQEIQNDADFLTLDEYKKRMHYIEEYYSMLACH